MAVYLFVAGGGRLRTRSGSPTLSTGRPITLSRTPGDLGIAFVHFEPIGQWRGMSGRRAQEGHDGLSRGLLVKLQRHERNSSDETGNGKSHTDHGSQG
jgi:hypothetical protein